MGQTLRPPSKEASATENHRKGKAKQGKSKKSKKKGAEMERPMDQEEQESAMTLIQMSGAPIQHSRAPYYEDSHARPSQLMPESSPMGLSFEPIGKIKSHETNEKRLLRKRDRRDIFDSTSHEEGPFHGAEQYPSIPSTPNGGIDRSSPSPYRPTTSPVTALDEIPTDDEVDAFEADYAKDTASADQPGLPDDDIFSFSQQQPLDSFHQDEAENSAQDHTQIPPDMCALPQKHEKHNKRKRKRRTDHQENFALEQGDSIPIDPKLHSIGALAPRAELSGFNDEDLNTSQKNGKDTGRHVSSRTRKRSRLEEMQGANLSDLPYMSPYSIKHHQENLENQVSPGFEDMQNQSSPRLNSPFPDSADDRDPNCSDNVNDKYSNLSDNVDDKDSSSSDIGEQVKKSVQRKGKGERKTARPKKALERSQKDENDNSKKEGKAEKFSNVEGVMLDNFRENYCEANGIAIPQFNTLIQSPMRGNAQVTALFNEIHDILPSRPRMSVQKYCRRRFHNYSRGAWSAEEDKMLKDAVAEKGKAWREIGDSLGRMAEDTRDRWRNYIDNAEHRNREQWTDAEVENLCAAILECWQLQKEERMRAREDGEVQPTTVTESDQEAEDMKHINWKAVSDRMGEHGGGRSRLQCSFKWGQLKKGEQARFLKAIKESRDIGRKAPTPAKNRWRMKVASKKVANMKPGDEYALLQAVANTNVPEEGNLPWKSLGDTDFRATWSAIDKKVAWSKLKGTVLGCELMDYRSIANELLSRLDSQSTGALDEKWDPELHGDVSEKKNRKRKKYTRRKDKQREKENEEVNATNDYLQGSIESVDDSGGMDGQAEDWTGLEAFEPQDHNRYDALSMGDDMDVVVNTNNGFRPINAHDEEGIFIDQRNSNGHLPLADGDVDPELAGKITTMLPAFS